MSDGAARCADVCITEFTDPGCPWAYSAEPFRRKLRWLYGDAIDWRPRMVVLAEDPQEYRDKGVTTEKLAAGLRKIAREHGMPIDTSQRPRMAATAPACRAVVATRLHAPEAEAAILRAFRVRCMSGELLDEDVDGARRVRDAGLDPDEVERWTAERGRRAGDARRHGRGARADPRGPRARRAPRQLVGRPALHVPVLRDRPRVRRRAHRRARLPAVRRLRRRARQPRARHRPAPGAGVGAEVLEWAGEPLATREVAVVCDIDHATAREELGRVADEHHVGADGFWSLAELAGSR